MDELTSPGILIFISLTILFFVLFTLKSRRAVKCAQAQGLWPAPGKVPEIADVKRLAKAGEKILAIKLYRQIRNVNLREAKDVVDRLAAEP